MLFQNNNHFLSVVSLFLYFSILPNVVAFSINSLSFLQLASMSTKRIYLVNYSFNNKKYQDGVFTMFLYLIKKTKGLSHVKWKVEKIKRERQKDNTNCRLFVIKVSTYKRCYASLLIYLVCFKHSLFYSMEPTSSNAIQWFRGSWSFPKVNRNSDLISGDLFYRQEVDKYTN